MGTHVGIHVVTHVSQVIVSKHCVILVVRDQHNLEKIFTGPAITHVSRDITYYPRDITHVTLHITHVSDTGS